MHYIHVFDKNSSKIIPKESDAVRIVTKNSSFRSDGSHPFENFAFCGNEEVADAAADVVIVPFEFIYLFFITKKKRRKR